jgi:hypothetical protein
MYRDPGESEDRYRDSRAHIAPLEAELSSFLTRTVAWQQDTTRKRQGVEATPDEELSEATRRNLEALGYIDPPQAEKKPN